MAAISELPHSADRAFASPNKLVTAYAGGEVHYSGIGSFNALTIITHDSRLRPIDTRFVGINTDPDGDEAWILSGCPSTADAAHRIRFMKDHHMEVSRYNGTLEPLRAEFRESDGILNPQTLLLQPDVPIRLPSYISPNTIEEIKQTFSALKTPEAYRVSFSQIKSFAEAPARLGVLVPNSVKVASS